MQSADLPTLIILTAPQLDQLIAGAIQRALDQYAASQPARPRLLKSVEMAKRLGICESQLGNLCKAGLPHVLVGDRQRRFEPETVLAWLRERGR
jgi:hypothetical protein